jgi:hypothetical protein
MKNTLVIRSLETILISARPYKSPTVKEHRVHQPVRYSITPKLDEGLLRRTRFALKIVLPRYLLDFSIIIHCKGYSKDGDLGQRNLSFARHRSVEYPDSSVESGSSATDVQPKPARDTQTSPSG